MCSSFWVENLLVLQFFRSVVNVERTSRPEIVLDVLQRAVARLRDTHGGEEQTEHTHHCETQVGNVQAVTVHQVGEGLCEHEGRQPADSHTHA